MEKYKFKVSPSGFGVIFRVHRFVLSLEGSSREGYVLDRTFKPFVTHSNKQAIEVKDILKSNPDWVNFPAPIKQFDEPKLFIHKGYKGGDDSYYLVHSMDDVYDYAFKVFHCVKFLYCSEPQQPIENIDFKEIDENTLNSLPEYLVKSYLKEKKEHDRMKMAYDEELQQYESFLKVKTGKDAYSFLVSVSDDYFEISSF